MTVDSLFQGDTERLRPHMEFLGDLCAKVELPDKKPVPVKVELLVWHNKEPDKGLGPFKFVLKGTSELTVTIKQLEIPPPGTVVGKDEACYRVRVVNGGISVSSDIIRPVMKQQFWGGLQSGTAKKGPWELAADKPVDLWKMTTANEMRGGDTMEEAVKRGEWGAVLRLSVRELDEHEK